MMSAAKRECEAQTSWMGPTRGWSDDAHAITQQRLRHELAWIGIVFKSEQRRATVCVETAGGRAANNILHDAGQHKTQDTS